MLHLGACRGDFATGDWFDSETLARGAMEGPQDSSNNYSENGESVISFS